MEEYLSNSIMCHIMDVSHVEFSRGLWGGHLRLEKDKGRAGITQVKEDGEECCSSGGTRGQVPGVHWEGSVWPGMECEWKWLVLPGR